jgi:hypothetical protein
VFVSALLARTYVQSEWRSWLSPDSGFVPDLQGNSILGLARPDSSVRRILRQAIDDANTNAKVE